jgi:hypothetical protein
MRKFLKKHSIDSTPRDLTQKERMDFVKTFKDNYEALTAHTTPHLTENEFLRFSHDAALVFADAIDRSKTKLLYGSALESFEPIEERRDFVQTFKDNYEALTVHTTPHLTENGFLRFPHDAAPFFSDAILESFTNNETSEDLTQKERMDFVKTFKDNYEALTAPTNEKGSLRLTRGSETVVAGTIAEALEPIDNGAALTTRTNNETPRDLIWRGERDRHLRYIAALKELLKH